MIVAWGLFVVGLVFLLAVILRALEESSPYNEGINILVGAVLALSSAQYIWG